MALPTTHSKEAEKTIRKAKKAFLEAFERLGTVEEACKVVDIAVATPYNWESNDAAFRTSFSRARELAAHLLVDKADRILLKTVEELRDRDMLDVHEKVGNPIARIKMAYAQNQIWRAGKWNREVYGDKQDVALSGTVALPAPTLNVHEAPKTETPT